MLDLRLFATRYGSEVGLPVPVGELPVVQRKLFQLGLRQLDSQGPRALRQQTHA